MDTCWRNRWHNALRFFIRQIDIGNNRIFWREFGKYRASCRHHLSWSGEDNQTYSPILVLRSRLELVYIQQHAQLRLLAMVQYNIHSSNFNITIHHEHSVFHTDTCGRQHFRAGRCHIVRSRKSYRNSTLQHKIDNQDHILNGEVRILIDIRRRVNKRIPAITQNIIQRFLHIQYVDCRVHIDISFLKGNHPWNGTSVSIVSIRS